MLALTDSPEPSRGDPGSCSRGVRELGQAELRDSPGGEAGPPWHDPPQDARLPPGHSPLEVGEAGIARRHTTPPTAQPTCNTRAGPWQLACARGPLSHCCNLVRELGPHCRRSLLSRGRIALLPAVTDSRGSVASGFFPQDGPFRGDPCASPEQHSLLHCQTAPTADDRMFGLSGPGLPLAPPRQSDTRGPQAAPHGSLSRAGGHGPHRPPGQDHRPTWNATQQV